MHPKVNRKLAIGAAVLAAAAFAGGAYAATQSSPVSVRQAFLNDVAKRLNVTPQQLSGAIRSAYFDELSDAVADHRLTQSQADSIKQRINQNGGLPLGGLLAPFPLTGAYRGRPFLFPAPARPMLVFGGLAAAARYLGLMPMQLLPKLASGRSLAQIATADGKSVSGLEQAIVASERSMLDKLVASKVITAAREQRLLAWLSKKVDALVNRGGFRMSLLPRPGLRRFGPLMPGKPRLVAPIPFVP
jgi:hypothetical protein